MKVVQSQFKTQLTHTPINTDKFIVGYILVFDLYIRRDDKFYIIIEKGTILTEELCKKIEEQDAIYIKREDVKKEKLTCESLKDYLEVHLRNRAQTLQYLYDINQIIFQNFLNSKTDVINLHCVKLLAGSLVWLLIRDKQYLKDVISEFTNAYQLDVHSLHVAIYSIAIGLALRLDSNELISLGIAGLLHDVGLKHIDQSVLHKNDTLTNEELLLVRRHIEMSIDILERNYVSDSVIVNGIKEHHENQNGTGYPNQLYARQISKFGSIIAIADVFDALTNNRPHRKAYTSFEALSIMMKDKSMAKKFKFSYLEAFLRLLRS